MFYRTLLLCLAFVFGCLTVIAQEKAQPAPGGDRPLPKQIAGGVLNGKAISLPKPPYPPAARAVKASGAVTVQVLIDEAGNVISAEAVSGHPLLRAASVEAARSAQFSPTRLSGQPVKVSGVITYNFAPDPSAKLGETGMLAQIPASDGNQIWALGLMFSFLQTSDAEVIRMMGNEQEFNDLVKELSTNLSSDMAQYKSTLEKLASPDISVRADASREFLRIVRKEFNTQQNWQVDVGEQVGFLLTELLRQKAAYVRTGVAYDPNVLRTHLSRLSDLLTAAPPDASAETVAKFRKIAAFADVTELGSDSSFAKLMDAISPLFEELDDR
jgi:TonB family protein